MKTELTSQQIESYQREGWLIIEDFLTPDELGELCSAIDAAVTQMGATRIADGGESNQSQVIETDSYYNRVFLSASICGRSMTLSGSIFRTPIWGNCYANSQALTASACGTIKRCRNAPGTTPRPGT